MPYLEFEPRISPTPDPRRTNQLRHRSEVGMEQRRNERTGETGDPRENPQTRSTVRHNSHMRKSECDPAGSTTWFALVGGEQSNRSTTAAPRKEVARHRASDGMPNKTKERKPNETTRIYTVHSKDENDVVCKAFFFKSVRDEERSRRPSAPAGTEQSIQEAIKRSPSASILHLIRKLGVP
ncbi:hypothetical protein PR048_019755 [Dryococelus australis]|uniref:Uncharacterized protein n=1 Tax=Dryococelus australis TaxID=614101 RepID=A0ABQ9H4C8_9NEOP|nr:hypothetical protein PR048_019755 [Dryococelus australis]